MTIAQFQKRGVVGTFHKVSRKYMALYVAEFQFRYNNPRMETSSERRSVAVDRRDTSPPREYAIFLFLLLMGAWGCFMYIFAASVACRLAPHPTEKSAPIDDLRVRFEQEWRGYKIETHHQNERAENNLAGVRAHPGSLDS